MINRRRSRKIRLIVFSLLLAVLIGGALWFIFYSPIFRLTAIEISGTEVLDASSVRAATEAWLSGRRFVILPKAHALLYQSAGLHAFLRNRFLRIASLNIEPDIRTHTLRITLQERRPEGFWCWAAPSCFLFDAEGILFAEIDRPQGSGGLVVEDVRGQTLAIGDRAVPPDWIEFMKSFADATAPEIWIRQYTIEPESLEAGYIRAQTGENWDVLLNLNLAAVEADAQILKELLKNEIRDKASRLDYIDLRVAGRAYYKLK